MASITIVRKSADYTPTPKQKFFFDTSIWIFPYGSRVDSNNKYTRLYSSLFKMISEAGAAIVIDYLVVAEFINRYLRDYHRLLRDNGEAEENWKQFRKSNEYKECVKGLADEIYHIMAACEKSPMAPELSEISKWTDEFADLEVDFNDVVYWKTCSLHGLIFVTHDSDCAFADIDIVSANPKLASVSAKA
jgi:predicted nucleic acid-binding protein